MSSDASVALQCASEEEFHVCAVICYIVLLVSASPTKHFQVPQWKQPHEWVCPKQEIPSGLSWDQCSFWIALLQS